MNLFATIIYKVMRFARRHCDRLNSRAW